MIPNGNAILDDKVKVQKAIDYLGILSASDKECADNYKMAISALLKQIPKLVDERPWTVSKCPCCGEHLGEDLEDGYVRNYRHMEMCPYCGQLLEWKSD